jgi:hypothetical protein
MSMSGGPIYHLPPYTSDTAGNAFPNFYAGAGGNASPTDYGLGIAASLGTDVAWQLRFPMPPSIPAGTLKLRTLMLANATSGTAKWTVSDINVAAGASASAAAMNSETQQSYSWTTGNADKYIETKQALTSTPSGNDTLVVALTFNHSGWTLAVPLTTVATIIWE